MVTTIFSGADDLIVILVAVVVLFGGSQLPKLARNTGQALRELRKAQAGTESHSATGPGEAAPRVPLGPLSGHADQVAGTSEVVTG